MTQIVSEERFWQTLGPILVSPAPRLPLFVGRAPSGHGERVRRAAFSFVVGGALLDVEIPRVAIGPMALVTPSRRSRAPGSASSSRRSGSSCGRTAVLSNIVFGVLLVFMRREHPARPDAAVDADDRRRPPVHARDRGGARDRRRRVLRRRHRARPHRAAIGTIYARPAMHAAGSSTRVDATPPWSGREASAASSDRVGFHLKSLTLSGFFLLTSVVHADRRRDGRLLHVQAAGAQQGTLFYAALGAAVYGIWSSTLFGSGGAIQWQRWQGTLELLVAAPAPFFLVVAAADPRDLDDRDLLARRDAPLGPLCCSGSRSPSSTRRVRVALPATILGLGLLGLRASRRRSSSTATRTPLEHARVAGAARHRAARADLAPARVGRPISWVLAPTWGCGRCGDGGVLAGTRWPDDRDDASCSSAVYLGVRRRSCAYFERRARQHATLSLT